MELYACCYQSSLSLLDIHCFLCGNTQNPHRYCLNGKWIFTDIHSSVAGVYCNFDAAFTL